MAEMTDAEAAEIAAGVWDLLHPDTPVVSRDWPVYRDIECGDLWSSTVARFEDGRGDYAWPVYPAVPDWIFGPTEPVLPDEEPDMVFFVESVPDYAREIDAAAEILDAWPGDIDLRRQNGRWRVTLFLPSREWQAWADTLPTAITLAALAAWPEAKGEEG